MISLGSVFMALDLGDQYKAQYFTPGHIAHFMAAVTLSDCHSLIKNVAFDIARANLWIRCNDY